MSRLSIEEINRRVAQSQASSVARRQLGKAEKRANHFAILIITATMIVGLTVYLWV